MRTAHLARRLFAGLSRHLLKSSRYRISLVPLFLRLNLRVVVNITWRTYAVNARTVAT